MARAVAHSDQSCSTELYPIAYREICLRRLAAGLKPPQGETVIAFKLISQAWTSEREITPQRLTAVYTAGRVRRTS